MLLPSQTLIPAAAENQLQLMNIAVSNHFQASIQYMYHINVKVITK
jgi:hypothetical protein